MVSMNVCFNYPPSPYITNSVQPHSTTFTQTNSLPDIPHPRRCLPHALQMYSHLQHPFQQLRRRCLPNHAIPLLPRLHNPLPRSLRNLQLLELRLQDLLHPYLAVCHIPDDANICANEGTGEGVEIRRRMSGGECGSGSARDVYFG